MDEDEDTNQGAKIYDLADMGEGASRRAPETIPEQPSTSLVQQRAPQGLVDQNAAKVVEIPTWVANVATLASIGLFGYGMYSFARKRRTRAYVSLGGSLAAYLLRTYIRKDVAA